MMKKIILTIVITSFLIISCTEDKKSPEELMGETPEAIEVSPSYSVISSSRGKWKKNIIERLYEEAIEKNINVSNISKSIEIANQQYLDSLIDYDKYIDINEEYWDVANSYIANISDTVLRESIKKVFDQSELDYCNSNKGITSLNDEIKHGKDALNNHVLLFKLAVTLPMIQNYQKNENPDSLMLKAIIADFDSTITKIKKYNTLKNN